MKQKKIMILGGTGMLGHFFLRYFTENSDYEVYATSRNVREVSGFLPRKLADRFVQDNVDAGNFDTIIRALASIQPDIVINCIGIVKQLSMVNDPLASITVNSQLPHRISLAIRNAGIRMIHLSTDCVFDGRKGMYTEDDNPSPEDLYGRSKLLGEVDHPNCVTLRKSVIGHELKGWHGLLEWFLGESGKVRGYRKAIYSGFPTVEFARIIRDYVLPDQELSGTYHVSSEPISKFDLLHLIAERYNKAIEIEPYEDIALDRSLVSERFRERTGYTPPSWPEMIEAMYRDYDINRQQYGR